MIFTPETEFWSKENAPKKTPQKPKSGYPKKCHKNPKTWKDLHLVRCRSPPCCCLKAWCCWASCSSKAPTWNKKSTSLFINSLATHPASEASELRLPLAELDGDRVKAGGDPLHLLLALPQLLDRRSKPSLKSLQLQPIKLSFLAQNLIWLIVIWWKWKSVI